MDRKEALTTGVTGQLLRAMQSIGNAGSSLWNKILLTPSRINRAARLKTLAPSNTDELMQLTLNKSMPVESRISMLDKAILNTARGVEAGEANLTTLQGLLRERELLGMVGSGGGMPELLSSVGRFASDNPALTALGVSLPAAALIARGGNRKRDEY